MPTSMATPVPQYAIRPPKTKQASGSMPVPISVSHCAMSRLNVIQSAIWYNFHIGGA